MALAMRRRVGNLLATGAVLVFVAGLLAGCRGAPEGDSASDGKAGAMRSAGRAPAPGVVEVHVSPESTLASSPELVAEGEALFRRQCAPCHGVTGRGDGEAAYLLFPKPRDFVRAEYRMVSTWEGQPDRPGPLRGHLTRHAGFGDAVVGAPERAPPLVAGALREVAGLGTVRVSRRGRARVDRNARRGPSPHPAGASRRRRQPGARPGPVRRGLRRLPRPRGEGRRYSGAARRSRLSDQPSRSHGRRLQGTANSRRALQAHRPRPARLADADKPRDLPG